MKFGLRFLMPLVGFTALTAALPAFAGDMVTFSGQVRTRGELNDNATPAFAGDTDNKEMWLNRFRLNVDVAPSSTLKAHLSTQFANTYGTDQSAMNAATNEVAAHEAYFAWTINNMWSVTAGRQTWNLGNGLIVGANDWGNTFASGTRFDGLKFVANHQMGTTLLAYAKMRESSATAGTADNDLYVFYNMFNVERSLPMFKNLDAYLLWNSDRQTGNRLQNYTLGALASGMNGPWDYSVELAAQLNKHSAARAVAGVENPATDDGKGFAGDFNLGYKHMAHHFGGEIGYFNTEWVSVAPANHNKRGLADIFSQGNLMFFALKSDWTWTDKIGTSINGYWFMAAKGDVMTAANNKVGGIAKDTASSQRNGALEADLTLNYKAEKNLGIDLGYSLVKPQSAIKNVSGQDHTISKAYLQGTMTF